MSQMNFIGLIIAVISGIYLFSISVYVLREYERGVVFRLGRLRPTKGPGLVLILPIIDKLVRVSLRTVTIEVPAQDVVTKDNVSVQVSAVVYFKVVAPDQSVTEIEDFNYATSQMSQTTLRSVLGQSNLDDLLAKRDELNAQLEKIIDEQTEPWGVEVTHVEVKNVDLPETMQRAIARQAEAERERRAKIIHAKGEHQAAEELKNAAAIIRTEPIALQLRYLQTLVEVGTESKATVIAPIPIPIDLIKPFMDICKKGTE
ncbi:MAG TPA: slipin family protein [Nitrospirae bacterium]|nr:slipin family protein [Nitrospirota bacterium]HDZ02049.1 slipin family protein [Nitrospirota bacterium]